MSQIIRLNSKTPTCPLCHKAMEREYVIQRNMFVWKCDKDRVAIAVDDPMVGKWDRAHEQAGKVECPACNASMRFFSTSIGFMKAVCPKKKCGASLSNAEPDRLKTPPPVVQ